MKTALLHEHEGLRTYVVILATGEETMGALAAFAADHGVRAAQFTAIGAFSRLVAAYFDWSIKDYQRIPTEEQVEVLSLSGDIALQDGKPKIHAHVVVSKADGTAHGGHLMEGHVRPTLEIVLTELPAYLRRRMDPDSGLALIDPERQ